MKKKVTRGQWFIVFMMIWGAAILIYLMISGFTYPFNGVEMKGKVKSLDELSVVAGTTVNDFRALLLSRPVFDGNYQAKDIKYVAFVVPDQEIGIIGISRNWSFIRAEGKEGWIHSMFIVIHPFKLNKGYGSDNDAHSYDEKE